MRGRVVERIMYQPQNFRALEDRDSPAGLCVTVCTGPHMWDRTCAEVGERWLLLEKGLQALC